MFGENVRRLSRHQAKTHVVLVIHEIFGMTDWVQDLADQVTAAGYIAVALGLLSGMATSMGSMQVTARAWMPPFPIPGLR